jgi:hypothetical protein
LHSNRMGHKTACDRKQNTLTTELSHIYSTIMWATHL